MLGKLIKYDIRFGAKKYAFMAALTAAALIVAVISLALKSELVSVLFIVLAVVATIAYAVMYIVVSVQHLYKQLCRRESYLNYSLPVSPHSLILSKIITILFWGIVTAAVVVLFWLVAVDRMVLAQKGMSLRLVWDTAVQFVRTDGGFELSPLMAKALIMGIIQSIMTVCMAAFCVSLANVPYLKERNWGVATGVVGFIVMYNVIGLIPMFIWWLIEKAGGGTDVYNVAGARINEMMTGLTWVSGITYVVFAIVFYFLTVRMVDKHRFIG